MKSENIMKVIDGKEVSPEDCKKIFYDALETPEELFQASQQLRKKFKGNTVTFSKKAFFNLINLCRDSCSYCTYKAEPNDSKASMMSKDQVIQLLSLAKKYRCVEVLFVTGEHPEQRYTQARKWLNENGFRSTAEYLIHVSEMALSYGMFPHTNAGNLETSDMRELRKTNVSLGLMLENVSDRLTEKDMPHYLAASKKPEERIRILKNAGTLKIPMTTGILVGIGETTDEIINSIFAIKNIHQKYGNIQEVILQNFQPKIDTRMQSFPSADEEYFKIVVALTRMIMPEMNIQIPPNLSPMSYQSFLNVGINDWGGISPLTPDYVNPEFSWPAIAKVEENSNSAGFELKCRFPVYPEFFSFVSKQLRSKMRVIENEEMMVKEEYWK